MLRRPLGATRTSKLFPNTTLFRSGYLGQSFLGLGNAYILTSGVVAVIGGVVLGGGRGDYVNVAIAAIFVTVLTSLLTAVQIGEASRQIIFGVTLLLFLAANRYSADKTDRKSTRLNSSH